LHVLQHVQVFVIMGAAAGGWLLFVREIFSRSGKGDHEPR
jgi:hypothetical protein